MNMHVAFSWYDENFFSKHYLEHLNMIKIINNFRLITDSYFVYSKNTQSQKHEYFTEGTV